MNVDRYHTTNRTATCNRPVFVGARGWRISSMVTAKIYDNGTYIGNSPKISHDTVKPRFRNTFTLKILFKKRFFAADQNF